MVESKLRKLSPTGSVFHTHAMKTSFLSKSPTALLSCLGSLFLATSSLAEQVIFTEIQYNAPVGQPDFIEITNNTGTPFDFGNWYFSDGITFTFPDFDAGDTDAHILKPFERILVSEVDETTLRTAYPNIPAAVRVYGPYTNSLSNSGETLSLSDKNGIVMTTVDYNDGGKWPAAPDGTGHTLTRINPNLSNAEWRNWMSSAAPGGTPGRPSASEDDLPTTTTQIFQTTSVWKYDQNVTNIDRGTTWREPDFDDSGWLEGPGPFGRNSADPFATPWTTGGRTTYYLRQDFQFNNAFSSATINIDSHLDDGLVVYLNGQEITRFNMPNGEIAYDTTASSGREWDDLAEIASGIDISAALQTGMNVLAVGVHNAAAGSSDIAFGANISITAAAPPSGALPNLIISEVHFGIDGNIDWIELHAPGNSPISAAGLKLSPNRTLTDTVDLTGNIPAGGYLSFPVTLPIDENGDVDLFLIQGNTVIDATRLDRDRGEEGFQSYPVGQEWFGGTGHTRDAPNDPASRQTNIVINEIMYDAPSDQGTGEYIELYNRGSETVDLSGWKISKGVKFDFPAGTSLVAGAYLVIAADAQYLVDGHGTLPVIGNWSGSLRDRGELLRIVDANGNLVDEVDYMPEGDWPNFADGDGSSMELRHPDMDNNISTAWGDSEESQKSTMQSFSYTAEFLRSKWLPLSSGQELQSHLVGDSHIILENVSVKKDGVGSNLVLNGGNMSSDQNSSGGWVCQGTHWASFFNNGQLNLVADGHGDNKANRAEVDMTAPIVGNSYTLSFDARWVSGKSRIIFQTLDHGFGTNFLIPIPANLGTPGAANSVSLASAAPTVTGVIHSPAVPGTATPVTVSARIDSADALSSAELVYRISNDNGNGTWVRRTLSNDGSGLFSTAVNNFTNQGDIIQFYVEAKSGSTTTFQPRYGPDRPAMWIVDGRDMPDKLLRERFIVSNYDRRALNTGTGGGAAFDYKFPRMSNHFFNATFIANESEIFYNAEIRKSGSPFTRATNSAIDHGKWKLPGDRLFRNRRRSVIDASGTSQGSGTPRYYDDRIARYFLYQLGHPINEMEFVHSVVNDDAFKLRENHEPISNDFMNRNFPGGSDGTLLRIDDEWRFTSDNGDSRQSRNADWSYKGTDNPTAYQSEWIMRSRESDHDFSNFIEFTRVIASRDYDAETLDRMADANMMALNAVVRGYDADWDTITVNRGKNAYMFRPKEGKGWMLIHWDGDRVFENIGQAIIGGRTGVSTYFREPHVKRFMNYYMTKLLNEHTKGSARTQAWMQAESDSVSGTGVIMPISHYTNWFNNRENIARNFIGNTTANTTFAVTTSNAATTDDLFTLAGTAPPTVFKVRVVDAAGTSFTWTDTTTWELTNIPLVQGSNSLAVEGLDHDGNIVKQLAFTITKSNNAAPVLVINATPKSLNVSLAETLDLDASNSFDPEGDLLTVTWKVTPDTGAQVTAGVNSASIAFNTPGFYLVTASTTDNNANTSTKTLGVSAYRADQFSTFGNPELESVWSPFKTDKHGNSPSDPYYSLQDNEGRLTIHIPVSTTPLGLPSLTLPPAVQYIDFGDVWKYDDSNDELTGIFAQPAYDDSLWRSGPGFLGFGEIIPIIDPKIPGLQTNNLRRDRNAGLVTYYFRTEFEFTGDPIGAQLMIDHLVDDGVRYYLNGQVIGSIRLPDGVIDSNTEGDKLPLEDIVEEGVLTLDVSSSLLQGTNVFAAEVHNESDGSSDLVFGARVKIAANPVGNNEIDLDDSLHPWVRRALPSGDWTLQTEVKLEKAQFGDFYAGLLVEADQDGTSYRYGVGIEDGTKLATFKVNPSGVSETMVSGPDLLKGIATLRLVKKENLLTFYSVDNGTLTQIQQITLPPGTTFTTGGVFASTETEQSLEASFDYAMLIEPSVDFAAWMLENGFADPDAEFGSTGLSNLLAYALGADLSIDVTPNVNYNGGALTFSHRQRLPVSELTYSVEKSTDLITWEAAGDLTPQGNIQPNSDGTFTVNLLSNIDPEVEPETFYRLIVTLP